MGYIQNVGAKYIYAKCLEWCLMCTQTKVLDCCFYWATQAHLHLSTHSSPLPVASKQWPEFSDVPELEMNEIKEGKTSQKGDVAWGTWKR